MMPLLLALLIQTETPREHVETVTGRSHAYRLVLGGVMDGVNTRDPIGYGAPLQGFEPMRSVRIENVGGRDVVNPWLLVNGKRRWRTPQDIVAEALASYGDPARMSDAEKARAVWEFHRLRRFHATTWDAEVHDVVKVYNVYGYTLCGDDAIVMGDLFRLAGLKVRRGYPEGHMVNEVWYDQGWHLFDGDEHAIYLRRDNRTIAGEEDIVRDHDLVKRTHTYGILNADHRKTDEFSASLYVHEGAREGWHPRGFRHTMDFTLRPGEALEWRFDHSGKQHTAGQDLREGWSDRALSRLRNGRWSFRPKLGTGETLWSITVPYVLVGGKLRARGERLAFSVSFDGRTWSKAGTGEQVDLDPLFPAKGPPRYQYSLRLDGGELQSLAIENDLQMAALGLPSLERGENVLAYSDETREPHEVRITHQWVERSGLPPPDPPPAPVSPEDRAEVDGTLVRFQWAPSGSPGVVDYHFQLSDREDFRWALSPNFDKLISRTADAGKTQYTLPYVGLLNPGERYFWRVRSRDDRRVWGAWSPAWSFRANAPGVPARLRWESGRLAWDPGPGRAAVRYEVHGSDERGFSIREGEEPVFVGNQKTGGLFPGKEFERFPATRVAEVALPPLEFRPTHAFYRVVAVDEKGVRSGASEALAAKRPFLYSEPVTEARAGSPYRYSARSIRSIGDLRCRTVNGDCYSAAFWDAETPRFALEQGPAWLSLDPVSGVLSGTPREADAGEHEVRIRVEIQGMGADLQRFTLRCGR